MTISAVLFDLAGTLLVPRPATDWVVRAARDLGVAFDDGELEALADRYLALDDLGTAPEETLMVGDHPTADGGAAAIGCPTLILPMSPPGAIHGLDRVLRLVGTGH